MPTQGSGRPDWTLSHSSIAQSVEHAAVNRRVVGSSPTGGAKLRLAASHDGKPLFPNIVRTVTGL